MSVICGPVDPSGIVGFSPGFTGGAKGVEDNLLQTTGLLVR